MTSPCRAVPIVYVPPAQQQLNLTPVKVTSMPVLPLSGDKINSSQLEMSLCPLSHTATLDIHWLPQVFIPLPTIEGSLQISQGSREILSSSEYPPHSEVIWGNLATHNMSCRLNSDEKPLTL